MFRAIFFMFLFAAPFPGQADNHGISSTEIKVGVLAFRGKQKALQLWQPTFDFLSQAVPGTRFKILPMSLLQLDNAVIKQELDFVITNPGQYVRIGTKNGMSWLATLKSRRHNQNEQVIGSALVVKNNSPYRKLDDLKTTHLGAVDPLAFGGFQVYWGEMAKQGYDPAGFFRKINFSYYPVDALIYWVRDTTVDAVIVPACLLEKMHEEGLINISDYRVLELKHDENYKCQTSSQLYPNWSFAKLRDTSPVLADKITTALLSLDENSSAAITSASLGWTAPVSTYDIHQLYQRLNIHPWQQAWWQLAWQWVLINWPWGALFVFVIILGFFHHLWIQLLVNRRTHELHQQQQQLEHAQRIAILGELSSDIAHELNQPLAAISNYAEGGAVRLKKQQDNPALIDLLDKISQEAQRSGEIIQRIRSFAKKQQPKKQATDLAQLINESLSLLQVELKKSDTNLTLELPKDKLIINIDPIEIQQVFINLIRNSVEALSSINGAHRIKLEVKVENNKNVLCRLTDNGPGISQSVSEQLFMPFVSTKTSGLGLGMSICKHIIEAHHGKIWVENNPTGGCIVNFSLAGSFND